MTSLLVVALAALINRLAGGGWPVTIAQGTPWRFAFGRIQSGVYIALAALLVHSWQIAFAFGAGFLFWRLFGWGHLISLGRKSGATERPATGVDHVLLEIAGPHNGLMLRMSFVLPMLVAVAYLIGNAWLPLLVVPFSILTMLSYEFWWRFRKDPIREAELTVGALWGLLILATAVS
jgi:hypothetical protein